MNQPLLKPTDTKEEQLEKLEYLISELREIPSHIAGLLLEEAIEKCVKLKFQGIELDDGWCVIFNGTYREIIMKKQIKPYGNRLTSKGGIGCNYCGRGLKTNSDRSQFIYMGRNQPYCSKKCRDGVINVSDFGKKILDSNR